MDQYSTAQADLLKACDHLDTDTSGRTGNEHSDRIGLMGDQWTASGAKQLSKIKFVTIKLTSTFFPPRVTTVELLTAAQAHHEKLGPGQLNMGKDASQISEGENSLLLDDQLCFALHAAARAMSAVYMKTLRDYGLTYPQYLVLICLLEEDGLTVGELGRRLHLDSGTLTPLLKRLEVDGAVVRQRANQDERRVEVRLTTKGRGYRDIAKRARALVLQRLRMNNQELSHFRSELANMTERLRDVGSRHD